MRKVLTVSTTDLSKDSMLKYSFPSLRVFFKSALQRKRPFPFFFSHSVFSHRGIHAFLLTVIAQFDRRHRVGGITSIDGPVRLRCCSRPSLRTLFEVLFMFKITFAPNDRLKERKRKKKTVA